MIGAGRVVMRGNLENNKWLCDRVADNFSEEGVAFKTASFLLNCGPKQSDLSSHKLNPMFAFAQEPAGTGLLAVAAVVMTTLVIGGIEVFSVSSGPSRTNLERALEVDGFDMSLLNLLTDEEIEEFAKSGDIRRLVEVATSRSGGPTVIDFVGYERGYLISDLGELDKAAAKHKGRFKYVVLETQDGLILKVASDGLAHVQLVGNGDVAVVGAGFIYRQARHIRGGCMSVDGGSGNLPTADKGVRNYSGNLRLRIAEHAGLKRVVEFLQRLFPDITIETVN